MILIQTKQWYPKISIQILFRLLIAARRYECEFPKSYRILFTRGLFGVAGTQYLPISFSFPLKKYIGVSLVIDKQALSDETRKMMKAIPIDLDRIGTTLGIEKKWYVNETPQNFNIFFRSCTKLIKMSQWAISK